MWRLDYRGCGIQTWSHTIKHALAVVAVASAASAVLVSGVAYRQTQPSSFSDAPAAPRRHRRSSRPQAHHQVPLLAPERGSGHRCLPLLKPSPESMTGRPDNDDELEVFRRLRGWEQQSHPHRAFILRTSGRLVGIVQQYRSGGFYETRWFSVDGSHDSVHDTREEAMDAVENEPART